LHELDIFLVLSVGFAGPELFQLGAPGAQARLCEELGHGIDERVHLFMVERVESLVHATQGNRVESQSGEVVGDINGFFGSHSRPLSNELRCDIVHLIVHILDAQRAKCWH
jgi:hypothetical protein